MVKVITSGDAALVQDVLGVKQDGRLRVVVEGFSLACKLGHVAIARLFFDLGLLNINQAFYNRRCPLGIAAWSGKVAVVKELITMGAYLDGAMVSTDPRNCPLWEAVLNNIPRMVRLLLNNGADPQLILELWIRHSEVFRISRPRVGRILSEVL